MYETFLGRPLAFPMRKLLSELRFLSRQDQFRLVCLDEHYEFPLSLDSLVPPR